MMNKNLWATENDGMEEILDNFPWRDLFAGVALLGMVVEGNTRNMDTDQIAETAYNLADSMMTARDN